MKNNKMASSKKILIASILVGIFLIGAIVTVVAVLAAQVQNIKSGVTVNYIVSDVGAKVSAKYFVVNPSSGAVAQSVTMTNGSNTEIEFGVADSSTTKTLSPSGDVNLSSTNSRIIYEYKFTNTADSPFKITLSGTPATKDNMTVTYKSSRTTLSDYFTEFTDTTLKSQLVVNKGDTIYIYISVKVTNINYGASYEGDIIWQLDAVKTSDLSTLNLNNDAASTVSYASNTIKYLADSTVQLPHLSEIPQSSDTTKTFSGYYTSSGTQYYDKNGSSITNIVISSETSAPTIIASFEVDPWASVVYPQTYVGDSLNSTFENLISSSSSSLVATGKKYTTDANGTTKECLEYTYNGQKYARLVGAVPEYTDIKWLNSTINTYNLTTTTITKGNNYWFKVEPIEFDTFTLSTGETVKMAKMILGSMAFSTSDYDWSADTCTLRTYLNSIFLTESGIDKVAKDRTYYSTKYLYSSSSPTLEDNGTQVTTKIWLPSCGEIQEMYTTTDTRKKVATDFARATYTDVYHTTDTSYMKDINSTSEVCSQYWLRSAQHGHTVFRVYAEGSIDYSHSINAYSGFSPAFVVG